MWMYIKIKHTRRVFLHVMNDGVGWCSGRSVGCDEGYHFLDTYNVVHIVTVSLVKMTAAHEHQSTNGCTVTLKLFLIIIMDVIHHRSYVQILCRISTPKKSKQTIKSKLPRWSWLDPIRIAKRKYSHRNPLPIWFDRKIICSWVWERDPMEGRPLFRTIQTPT
jgi:hypothetical protein